MQAEYILAKIGDGFDKNKLGPLLTTEVSYRASFLNRNPIQFTNEEIMEIYRVTLSTVAESPFSLNSFFTVLISNQSDSFLFSSEVFNTFLSKLTKTDITIKMINQSPPLDENGIYPLMDHVIGAGIDRYIDGVPMLEKYVFSDPWISKVAAALTKKRCALESPRTTSKILSKLPEKKRFTWVKNFLKNNSGSNEYDALKFIFSLKDLNKGIIEQVMEIYKSNITMLSKMTKFENFSDTLKLKIFKETGDKQFIPNIIDQYFVF